MPTETLEQFLARAKCIGFHPEAIARILIWKLNMTRGDAEKCAFRSSKVKKIFV